MFFLATTDADGHPQCSYKGGDPDSCASSTITSLVFPVYDGNGMFLSLGNIRQQAHVGMLFVDFEQPNRLRVNGIATVDEDDPFAGGCSPARSSPSACAPTHVFPNCGRYIHTMQLVERSKFVPQHRRGHAGSRLEAHDVGAGVPAGRRSGPGSRADHVTGIHSTGDRGSQRTKNVLGSPFLGGRSELPATRANRSARGATSRARQMRKTLRPRTARVRPALSTVAVRFRTSVGILQRTGSGTGTRIWCRTGSRHRTRGGSPRPAIRRRRRSSPSPRIPARARRTRHASRRCSAAPSSR